MTNILFHDIDGCLNTADGKMLPFELHEFDTSQQASLDMLGDILDESPVDIMALNTGRSLESTLIIAEAIDSPKVKYVIAEHGAIGYRLDTCEFIDFELLAEDLPEGNSAYKSVQSIPDLIDWYNVSGAELLSDQIGGHAEIASQKMANLTLAIPDGVSGEHMKSSLKDLIESNSPLSEHPFVYHHSTSDGYVDVLSQVDKGTGVRLICMMESIPGLATFAVGNGLNDTAMFEQVDSVLCPFNSEQELKDFCQTNNGLVSEHSFIDATIQWLKLL